MFFFWLLDSYPLASFSESDLFESQSLETTQRALSAALDLHQAIWGCPERIEATLGQCVSEEIA